MNRTTRQKHLGFAVKFFGGQSVVQVLVGFLIALNVSPVFAGVSCPSTETKKCVSDGKTCRCSDKVTTTTKKPAIPTKTSGCVTTATKKCPGA